MDFRDTDFRHLWHPYTDIDAFEREPYTCIERGEGVFLHTTDGHRMYDGIASWWAVPLGHSHPRLVEAMRAQAGVLQHSILGNLSHPMAVRLAERLAGLAPEGLGHVYFACDGSSATEAAMKMAVQYWRNVGQPNKTRFIGLAEGYHGDTLGAMGVGFTSWFQEPFKSLVMPQLFAPSPHCTCCAYDKKEGHCALGEPWSAMERLIAEHHNEVAAVMAEPLCQASAGMRIYPAEYLRRLRRCCCEHGVLLIADEIAVGFGRTGAWWACDHAEVTPDILCVGKALTGGYLPMSAAIANDAIYDSFRGGGRRFWDGHTYCGNPITSAVALAALDVFEEENLPEACAPAMAVMRSGFESLATNECVAYQKTLGMIGMCALSDAAGGAELARRVSLKAMKLGLFIRPLGEVLYLWPPLITTPAQLEEIFAILRAAIEAEAP